MCTQQLLALHCINNLLTQKFTLQKTENCHVLLVVPQLRGGLAIALTFN